MDRAEELRRCLKSLALLNYPEEKLQIIVVDDGSSDDSPMVARELGALVVSSGGIRYRSCRSPQRRCRHGRW